MKKLLLLLIPFLFISCTKEIDNSIHIERMISPVKKELIISSEQGLREKIVTSSGGETSGKYHDGLDIIVKEKTPILAIKDGIVKDVYPSYYNGEKWKGHPVYGGLIVIEHYDNTISLYAHLSLTEVKEGDIVKQGQEIGWSGGIKGKRGSGISTGAHLHFNIYLNINSLLP